MANAAASRRECTWSLVNTLWACARTVFCAIPRRLAISVLLSPSTNNARISFSRWLSCSARERAACSSGGRTPEVAWASRLGMTTCPARTACNDALNWLMGVSMVRYPWNPRPIACFTVRGAATAVTATTFVWGSSWRILFPTERPLMPGRLTSSRTRSGFSRPAISRASSPDVVTPTTSSPCSSRIQTRTPSEGRSAARSPPRSGRYILSSGRPILIGVSRLRRGTYGAIAHKALNELGFCPKAQGRKTESSATHLRFLHADNCCSLSGGGRERWGAEQHVSQYSASEGRALLRDLAPHTSDRSACRAKSLHLVLEVSMSILFPADGVPNMK